MLQYIPVACLAYVLWKLYRRIFPSESLFDNLHGPPSPSWLTGNMLQLLTCRQSTVPYPASCTLHSHSASSSTHLHSFSRRRTRAWVADTCTLHTSRHNHTGLMHAPGPSTCSSTNTGPPEPISSTAVAHRGQSGPNQLLHQPSRVKCSSTFCPPPDISSSCL
ncbi:hypothetical protein BC628DRAFT_855791 [Trametes gibbosa]|nr:hypothetical protein BC628DRAFT_855791 [Trametes gibbosa]